MKRKDIIHIICCGLIITVSVYHIISIHKTTTTENATQSTFNNSVVEKARDNSLIVSEKADEQPIQEKQETNIHETIKELCTQYNIDYNFVVALITVESNFNEKAISSTDDYGLMQINKVNHKRLSELLNITDFLDPTQNVQCGLYMLNDLFKKYKYNNLVLMAYNLGETKAKSYWDKGIYNTEYSRKVLDLL